MYTLILLGNKNENSQLLQMLKDKFSHNLAVLSNQFLNYPQNSKLLAIIPPKRYNINTQNAIVFLGNHFRIEKLNSLNKNNFYIVNSSNIKQIEKLAQYKLKVITVGMSNKDTVTVSSCGENKIVASLQRSIKFSEKIIIEPMEKIFDNINNFDFYCVLAFITIKMLTTDT